MNLIKLYHMRSQIANLDRTKASGLVDRKSVHIANIERLTIDQPRELSCRPKSQFVNACGIYLILCFIALLSTLNGTTIPLHICTVASHPTTTLAQLSDSCNANGIQLDVLGIGLPYRGNGQKLSYLKRYVEELPEGDIVLFVDAYDTLVLENKKTIISKFLAYNCHCVVGAETCFCPHSRLHYKDQVPEAPTKFKYLNSGTIIGYAGFIRSMLQQIPIDETTSDQGQLWDYYMKHPDEIVLDYYADLFLTLQSVDTREVSVDVKTRRVHYLPTGTTPIVVHGNGEGKPYYQNMYDKLFKKKFHGPYVWRLEQPSK